MMSEQKKQAVDKMTFEEALAALEEIVSKLEESGLPLEESIKAYEYGVVLKKHAENKLKEATLKVEKITFDQSGSLKLEPLDAEQ